MNINDFYPSEWVGVSDLNGRKVEITITGMEVVSVFDPIGKGQQDKMALSFAKTEKRLLLNKTQAFSIAGIANSDETDDWKGLRVALSPGTARNGKPTIVISQASQPTPEPEIGDAPSDEHEDAGQYGDDPNHVTLEEAAEREMYADIPE